MIHARDSGSAEAAAQVRPLAAPIGVYLKGHAGDDYRLNRINRPNEYVKRPAITCGLAVQPDVMRGLIDKPGLRGWGLLARFFYSLPTSKVGFRDINAPTVPLEVIVAYSALVRAAIQIPTPLDEKDDPVPHVVRLSSEAWSELTAFREQVEIDLRASGSLSTLRD